MLPFIVCGDFNFHLNRQKQLICNYQSVIAVNNFVLGVWEPTPVTQTTASCLKFSTAKQLLHQASLMNALLG